MKRKILSVFLCILMCLSLFSAGAFAAEERSQEEALLIRGIPAENILTEEAPPEGSPGEEPEGPDGAKPKMEPVTYMEYKDGHFEAATCEDYVYYDVDMFTAELTLVDGWYVLDDGMAGARINISGNVNFILLNDSNCYFTYGIGLHAGSTLSIYVQTHGIGSGILCAGQTGSDVLYGAGIGGDYNPGDASKATCGDLYVYGGMLDVNGSKNAAGIGGGYGGSSVNGGNVYVYGGTVYAYGGDLAAGIGAGAGNNQAYNGGNVTVYGGTVHAYGGECAAGIGGGSAYEDSGDGGNVTVYDGTVYAYGGNAAAGIGGGSRYSDVGIYSRDERDTGGVGGNFVMHGGNVYAYGGNSSGLDSKMEGGGAGIGGSVDGAGGSVTVNGGTLQVTGGADAAGIGGGGWGGGGTFTINGGKVIAKGGDYGAAIGGGREAKGGSVYLNGGELDATYGYETFAIGGGDNIDKEGDVYVKDGFCVFDLRSKQIYNADGRSRSWNDIFQRKEYVHVKLVSSEDEDMSIPVDYLAYDEETETFTERTSSETVPVLNEIVTLTTWTGGWYAINSNITIDERINVSGNVSLILMDGCTLNANKGIRVEEGSSLKIYAQSTAVDTVGRLNANGSADGYSAIGSGPDKAGGPVTFYGGYTVAHGGKQAAGIGGGAGRSGSVTVCGGTVIAYGGDAKDLTAGNTNVGGGAGIGGGYNSVGFIEIYGGSVTAHGGNGAAGIGGGCGVFGLCDVLIDGDARVIAYGGASIFIPSTFEDDLVINPGPGIGCGVNAISGTVEIRRGSVHAITGENLYAGPVENTDAVLAPRIIMNPYADHAIKVTADNGENVGCYYVKEAVSFPGETDLILESAGNTDVPVGEDDIPYMAYKDGKFEEAYCGEYTRISVGSLSSGKILTSGWYVLDSGTAGGRITVSGDVRFILLNGADCYFRDGIGLHDGSTLTIYAQPEEIGKSVGQLRTKGSTDPVFYSSMSDPGGAGIGGDYDPDHDLDVSCGNLYIHGGKLDIRGTDSCAGIGGSGYVKPDGTSKYLVGNGGNVTIYGGDVTATGGRCGAGIGGGSAAEKAGNGGNVTVYGGTVHAYGGDACAGIGGGTMINDNIFSSTEGSGGSGGNFVMYGGAVYAYGGNTSPLGTKDVGGGAGIGGGLYGEGGSVTVNGGTLEARGAEDAAGIGGGGWSEGGTFTLNGGKVSSWGGRFGAAIGGGREAGGSQVHLNGGELDATYGYETFAIGGGDNIDKEGDVYVKDGVCVFDLRSKQIYNADGRSRSWNDIFQRKEYVHVKLVSSEDEDMSIPADYLKYNEETKEFAPETNQETVPIVNGVVTLTTWTDGWYVLDSDAAIDEVINVRGNVNLILADGCTLNANRGIRVEEGSSLNVYAQSTAFETVGKLNAAGSGDGYAGIGSGPDKASGPITFYGGYVIASGGKQAAGIGGGQGRTGNVTVYGGTVIGYGGDGKELTAGNTNVGGGAGIGGGYNASGNVKIYGGSVTAHGGKGGAAGIGGGRGSSGSCSVLIDGDANINAYGGESVFLEAQVYENNKMIEPGPGIGSGANCTSGTVDIRDGAIHAAGGENHYTGTVADSDAIRAAQIGMNPKTGDAIKVTTDNGKKETLYSAHVNVSLSGQTEIFLEFMDRPVVPYLAYEDGELATKDCEKYIAYSTDSLTSLTGGGDNDGWYVLVGGSTKERINIVGDVKVILQDGCTFRADDGILVEAGSSLTVYAQSTAYATVGKLTATSSTDGYAGIGSGPNKTSGPIAFHGGYVIGNGGKQAAGIGGGSDGAGTVTVYGGTIFGNGGAAKELTLTSTNVGGGAGIGGGYNAPGTVKIYGGRVNAHGGNSGGAGIGGGAGQNGGCSVLIDGDVNVTAYGGANAFAKALFITRSIDVGPGIGGGAGSKAGTVEMRDGKVLAMAGENNYVGNLTDGEALKAANITMNPYVGFAIKRTAENSGKETFYPQKTDNIKFTGTPAVNLESVLKTSQIEDAGTPTHTVTFIMNGHGEQTGDQKIETGGTAARPEDPACEGYVFAGWYKDADLTAEFDFSSAITADTEIYAKWTKTSSDPVSPQTGDDSHMFLWMALLCINCCIIIAASVNGKRRRNAE